MDQVPAAQIQLFNLIVTDFYQVMQDLLLTTPAPSYYQLTVILVQGILLQVVMLLEQTLSELITGQQRG